MNSSTVKTTQIMIEKGVPVPERNRLPELPLEGMSVGDSFFLEMATDNDNRAVQTLRQRISRFQSKHPTFRFTVRRDDTATGMRVWRVI
tara:strand:- start:281 stop:547 length:267 start_codon:yes stop_codon:yes gene_type:complete